MKAASSIVFRRMSETTVPIDVSVVIPTYNGALTLDDELGALAGQETDIPFEVLISDNGSTDNSRDVAIAWADRFAAFTVVDASGVQGVSHARNEGARSAMGSKILICDADDVVCPTWVEPLATALDEYDAVGGAARLDRINSPDVWEGENPVTQGLNHIFGFLPYALGGSFGVRRNVLLAVRGFDSSYQKGHEETDFCWRLQLAGFSLGWRGEAVVDYRQRSGAKAAMKQYFNFSKSSILLWCRYSAEHSLNPVSFSRAVKNLIRQIVQPQAFLNAATRRKYARRLGWAAGAVAGHLSYRIIGSPPERIVMSGVNGAQIE
jgi:GT2 family glycosyltransferase